MEKALLEKSLFARHGQLPGPIELAYLGDTIYDLYVRTMLTAPGGRVKALHLHATQLVCCSAQARALARIEPMLTDPERAAVRRARNAHQTPPRHADPADYHRATALEALIGQLYLTGDLDRLDALMRVALADPDDRI